MVMTTGTGWFWYAPPAQAAWGTVVAVHNRYYAPFYWNSLNQVRTEAAAVARGDETIDDAIANLTDYFNTQIPELSTNIQNLVSLRHPYRADNINPAIDSVLTQLQDQLVGDNGIITTATDLNAILPQVASALRWGYRGVRVAIQTGGWAPTNSSLFVW